MKIGIIFAGIAFGHKSDRDFQHCYPNIKRNLIDPLTKDHEVSIYVTTYNSDRDQEVIDLLKPKKISFLDFNSSRQNPTRKAAVELTDGEDLDFYIVTRFDVHYNYSWETFNVDFDKFNFTSREGNGYWERERFVGDTFYAWPKRLNDSVKAAFNNLMSCDPNHMHNFYSLMSQVTPQEDIHFMSEEHQLSGHLLTSICTRDYADRLRGIIPVNQEILDRFK